MTSLDLLGKSLAESMGSSSSSSGVTVSYATVTAVHEYTSDIKLDVSMYGGTLYGLSMTTGCRGVAVGDRVIVQTYGHLSVVTGVIAHDNYDNTPYVKRAGDTLTINGVFSGYLTSSATALRFNVPCVYDATPSAASSFTIRVRSNGSYVLGGSTSYETVTASNISIVTQGGYSFQIAMTVSASDGNNHACAVVVGSGTIKFS